MLSEKNANLLCDIRPGTTMNAVFKRMWLPVMTSNHLAPGSDPEKIRVLGQSFVAFRASNGQLAVFDEKCPHRGCSLELANVQDDSLRCIFHGWKFHVSGKCVETPNEPDPRFPSKVPLKSYPVKEAGGAVWVYFGEGEAPELPDLIFNLLADDQLCSRRAVCDYNWLTGLEAILDPSHLGILHSSWIQKAPDSSSSVDLGAAGANLAPTLECEETDYGFRYVTLRSMGDGSSYIRVSEIVAPNGVFIATTDPGRKLFIMSVPIDNFTSMQWYFRHSPDGPMPESDRSWAIGRSDPDDNDFYQTPKTQPRWGQDRGAMRRGESFTGFTDIMFEDFIVGESQGAWPDRTKEFLGTADKAIHFARQYLLERLKSDVPPLPKPGTPLYQLQALAARIPGDEDWRLVTETEQAARAERYAGLRG